MGLSDLNSGLIRGTRKDCWKFLSVSYDANNWPTFAVINFLLIITSYGLTKYLVQNGLIIHLTISLDNNNCPK